MKHIKFNNSSNIQNKQQSFKGYEPAKDYTGGEIIKFYAPPYDSKKYDIALEFVPVKLDSQGNWVFKDDKAIVVPGSADEFKKYGTFWLDKKSKEVSSYFDNEGGLAYRYVLTSQDKNNPITKTVLDPGTKVYGSKGGFNVIPSKVYPSPSSGSTYHMFFNSYAPSPEAIEEATTRNHFNDAGGSIKGVIDKLNSQNNPLEPYKYILSTPIFGKDDVSSHGYWTTNPYQINIKAGTLDDFKELQTTLFDSGKTWIADGAFTSQGYQSAQLASVLKWGEESPFYGWFKANGDIALGVLPDKTADSPEVYDHLKYRLVNHPASDGYSPEKPTYIQFYDDRMVGEEQLSHPNELIRKYDKFGAMLEDGSLDPYAISTHQDSVQPYYFEIPKGDKYKLGRLKRFENQSFSSIQNELNELMDFGTFKIADKATSGGATFWSGNLDLVKMNLSDASDASDISRAGLVQARNYLYGTATYWTRTAKSVLLEHLSKKLTPQNFFSEIKKISKNYNVEAFEEVINNAKSGNYNSDIINNARKLKTNDFLLEQIVDFPLESIEFNPELTAVLTSPYVTSRPMDLKYQGMSRLDMVKGNYPLKSNALYEQYAQVADKMNSFYKNELLDYVKKVLSQVQTPEGEKMFDEAGELTEYGIYASRILTPEITKFAIVKSLFGSDDIKLLEQDGSISYDTSSLSGRYLKGVSAFSPKDEADSVVKKLTKGFSPDDAASSALIKTLSARLADTSTNQFRVAEAILDQTGAGLNWRFNAAKDIADIDKILKGTTSFEKAWDDVIDFWSHFIHNIKAENPSAYTIAEVTDIYGLAIGNQSQINGNESLININMGKYAGARDVTPERLFLEKTGASTLSNYSHFYSTYPAFFSPFYNDISNQVETYNYANLGTIKGKTQDFLSRGPLQSVNQSHVFVENHDKPRVLHAMALDNELFMSSFQTQESVNKAKAFLGSYVDFPNTSKLSSEGVAVGIKFDEVFSQTVSDSSILKYIKQANVDLSLGKFKSNTAINIRRARAFGDDDFESAMKTVLDQAIYLAKQNGDEAIAKKLEAQKVKIVDDALELLLEEPMRLYSQMWKMMCTSVGNPTLYNGAEYAQSGHETPSKNIKVKNRGIIKHHIMDNPNAKQTIQEFNHEISATSSLHKMPGLSALAGGSTSVIGVDYSACGSNLFGVIKNNDADSLVMTLYTPVGLKTGTATDLTSPVQGSIKANEFWLSDIGDSIADGTFFKRAVYNKATGKYMPSKETYRVWQKGNGKCVLVNYADEGNTTGVFKQVELDDVVNIFYRVTGDAIKKAVSAVDVHNMKNLL